MNIDLTGRTILVTGASRGIGRALAQGLADAGATLAVHYHRDSAAADSLVAAVGRDARTFQADLADPAACDQLFDSVAGAYDRLDVLVNNAGMALKLPLDLDSGAWRKGWDRTMAVNLRAVEALSRRAIGHFREHDGGRIINIASRAAFRGDVPEYMSYAASKGGMVALTRSIARAYGKDGIRAFVLAPGFVRTEMAQDFIDEYGEDHVLDELSLERLTEPEDLVPLVVLLASGGADHATGTSIDVNAGSYVR